MVRCEAVSSEGECHENGFLCFFIYFTGLYYIFMSSHMKFKVIVFFYISIKYATNVINCSPRRATC